MTRAGLFLGHATQDPNPRGAEFLDHRTAGFDPVNGFKPHDVPEPEGSWRIVPES